MPLPISFSAFVCESVATGPSWTHADLRWLLASSVRNKLKEGKAWRILMHGLGKLPGYGFPDRILADVA